MITNQSISALPAAAALLASAMFMTSPALSQSGMNTTALQSEAVLEGLENPWDMAFLEDGTMLFTEKCKGLSVRMPDGSFNALYGMGETAGYASNVSDLFC